MPQFKGVVRDLIIINALLYFAATAVFPSLPDTSSFLNWLRNMQINMAIFYPTSEHFHPYEILTHMFMHGSFTHLLFNMFGLWMFGSVLEQRWGGKTFTTYYFLCGLGAIALHMLVWFVELQSADAQMAARILRTPVLGASGAIYGLMAGYAMKYPNSTIMLIFPPIPMKAKYFVLVFAAIELFYGFTGMQAGIAHFAHVGGALIGFLLIRFKLLKGL